MISAGDSVYVITDAWGSEEAGRNSLLRALGKKNSNIHLIRWCQDEKFI